MSANLSEAVDAALSQMFILPMTEKYLPFRKLLYESRKTLGAQTYSGTITSAF